VSPNATPTIPDITTPDPPVDSITGLPLDIPAAKEAVGTSVGDWDCVPQGLEPSNLGRGKFSMGGGQDSTYEYFPKVCIPFQLLYTRLMIS